MGRHALAALLLLAPPATALPEITVLGTLDLLLVETTPVVIDEELWLFESVRPDYWNNTAGHEYLRFKHMQSGRTSTSFGAGHALGSAIVDPSGVFAFGTKQTFGGCADSHPAAGQVISVFWSTDGLQTWHNQTAIDISKDTKVPGRSKRVIFVRFYIKMMILPLKMMILPLKMMILPLKMMILQYKMMILPLKMMSFVAAGSRPERRRRRCSRRPSSARRRRPRFPPRRSIRPPTSTPSKWRRRNAPATSS